MSIVPSYRYYMSSKSAWAACKVRAFKKEKKLTS